MTPEQLSQLNELLEWKKQKETQQLSLPVDDASKNALGALIDTGLGASGNTSLNLTGGAETIVVTVATGVLTVRASNGALYNLLYK